MIVLAALCWQRRTLTIPSFVEGEVYMDAMIKISSQSYTIREGYGFLQVD